MQIEQVSIKVLPDGRVPAADAAKFLNLAEMTLANWRSQGIGPDFSKQRGRVYYALAELERFRDDETERARAA